MPALLPTLRQFNPLRWDGDSRDKRLNSTAKGNAFAFRFCEKLMANTELDKLLAELRAIELWDETYELVRVKDSSSTQAYAARQHRSDEILDRIRVLIHAALA